MFCTIWDKLVKNVLAKLAKKVKNEQDMFVETGILK